MQLYEILLQFKIAILYFNKNVIIDNNNKCFLKEERKEGRAMYVNAIFVFLFLQQHSLCQRGTKQSYMCPKVWIDPAGQKQTSKEGTNKKTGRGQVFPFFVETNIHVHPLKNSKSQKE